MVDERGKLDFSDIGGSQDNSELNAMKQHWESFLDSETGDRDKYLRALEIEFSLDAIANGESDTMIDDEVARVFSDRKHVEHDADARVQKRAFRNLFKG